MLLFLESPVPVLVLGVAVEILLALLLFSTGRGRLLWWMGGVALVTVCGVVLERMVVTDREAVTERLLTGAKAAERNDLPRLLDCVSPTAGALRAETQSVLQRFEVRKLWIRRLTISFEQRAAPPRATARFHLVGNGRDRQQELPYETFSLWMTVFLQKEGERWLATGYEVSETR